MFGQDRLGEDKRFEKEEKTSLEEAAAKLEEIASALRTQGKFTEKNENHQITISPSREVNMLLEYVKKGKNHKTGFYLEWHD
ncbi:amphi-Trp domain-containing protein [Alteribacillus sp. YIM 98480]|uniref:amphi-Trp domain-containing protein n=1 Tax=Alteribacillus sp. YIM 98480 TaxID=2606599 RepID=UPI00131A8DA1|nr:amphi-Trp domain-containing protein [Alteribacillus sp. YIM 98480]